MSAKKVLLYLVGLGVVMILISFVLCSLVIGREVKEECTWAKERYGGNCTEALIQALEDESNPFGRRNTAIWALGQLGDKRAEPVLESMFVGEISDREPWNGTISQYELSKALKLVRGGLNATAVFWRQSLN